ncbi:MAG: sugar ABC transporter ATP-binding protein [Phycisphaeraceae bacterium]|nr:sugar ABC transporter ATP-binding protein [Phycisphaeraceae bacterium]
MPDDDMPPPIDNAASQAANRRVILCAEGISKRFGITRALSDVSVSFLAGEVHALMGENGAGKSTLGKVISGLHRQDAGTVRIAPAGGDLAREKGRVLKPGSIDDAFDAGVRIVHQELAQCPNLTVAENLCLHDLPRSRLGLVDFREAERRAARLLARLEPAIDVRAPLGTLSPGHRQIVQIAQSLDERSESAGATGRPAHSARVIVLDEPTSSLAVAEVDRLLAIVRQLAADGLTLIYVSHRMGEIFSVCDRVTVLRDGQFVATSNVRDIDEPTLVEQMIGRKVSGTPRGARAVAPMVESDAAPRKARGGLVVRDLSSPGKLANVSLSVRPGEIVGVGGLVGAGRSELLDAIFGLDPRARGAVEVNGRRIAEGRHAGPRESIRAGLGYVPEDRKLQGLFFLLDVSENIAVPVMPRLARAGFRRTGAEARLVGDRLRDFQVKTATVASLPGELSGGNQQKLLLARWMGAETRVLLLDEPTRGIDVGTKAEVYRLISAAADAGAAVLLVSSEMPELLMLSDRVLVLAGGRVTGELSGERMTQAEILRLATRENAAAAAPA